MSLITAIKDLIVLGLYPGGFVDRLFVRDGGVRSTDNTIAADDTTNACPVDANWRTGFGCTPDGRPGFVGFTDPTTGRQTGLAFQGSTILVIIDGRVFQWWNGSLTVAGCGNGSTINAGRKNNGYSVTDGLDHNGFIGAHRIQGSLSNGDFSTYGGWAGYAQKAIGNKFTGDINSASLNITNLSMSTAGLTVGSRVRGPKIYGDGGEDSGDAQFQSNTKITAILSPTSISVDKLPLVTQVGVNISNGDYDTFFVHTARSKGISVDTIRAGWLDELAGMGVKIGNGVPFIASDGGIYLDTGTKTKNVAADGTATLNKLSGRLTTANLSTAAGGEFIITLTNSTMTADKLMWATVCNMPGAGGNTTRLARVTTVTPSAGALEIGIQNGHASSAWNGRLMVAYGAFNGDTL